MGDSWERVGESGRGRRGREGRLWNSMWMTDVRNKVRRAKIPPEAVLPGPNCLLLKNKTLIQQPGMGN